MSYDNPFRRMHEVVDGNPEAVETPKDAESDEEVLEVPAVKKREVRPAQSDTWTLPKHRKSVDVHSSQEVEDREDERWERIRKEGGEIHGNG